MKEWIGLFYYLQIPIIWLFEKAYIFLYGKKQFKKNFKKVKGLEE